MKITTLNYKNGMDALKNIREDIKRNLGGCDIADEDDFKEIRDVEERLLNLYNKMAIKYRNNISFADTLKMAENYNIDSIKFIIAYSLKNSVSVSEEDFEILGNYVLEIYLRTEENISEICKQVFYLLERKYSASDISEMSPYDFFKKLR